MLKILKSNAFLISLLAIIVIVFIGLINTDYFGQVGDLSKLLPDNTLVTVDLDLNELNATINQKNRLSKSQFIQNFISQKSQATIDWLKSYGLDWPEMKKYLRPQANFYLTPTDNMAWGLLIQGDNKQIQKQLNKTGLLTLHEYYNSYNIYKLTAPDQPIIYFAFVNDRIVSLSSSPKLCQQTIDNYSNHQSTGWQKIFSTISLKPLITIKINPEIENYLATNPILPEIYELIRPLIIDGPQELQIEINQQGDYLDWQIINYDLFANIFEEADTNILFLLNNIHLQPLATISMVDLQQTGLIQDSPLYQYFIKTIAEQYNFSLNTVINELSGPTVLSLSDKDAWLLITTADQEQTIINTTTNILAKLKPQQISKLLPDQTVYTELIADPTTVQQQEIGANEDKIITLSVPDSEMTFNYYRENGYLIISNSFKTLNNNKESANTYQHTCHNEKNIQNSLYLNLATWNEQQTNDILDFNLSEISELIAYSQDNDQNTVIKGCLRLK
ncbi:MAG: hypothetical protein CO073_04335 [Candidatus Komeilibacteria bacterium CG_4_9_14_0_8_um_filter_36_9]|uniref:DUF3352 domain-containing protein n=1 Tax=Candidatus Komeilibacteria bacterium CG_4_9_14_0_8_um_filter_36_9 TaxID=1974473 RepID=A0A2M8DQ74_9BACT|nr:MAG: hypothetical protein CO073_04335 [Candidatus Komeilibacteria bacterium CG_4_9_14_0_8_um_filter_36_9]